MRGQHQCIHLFQDGSRHLEEVASCRRRLHTAARSFEYNHLDACFKLANTAAEGGLPKQQGLGRPTSKRAALIPIRKTATWWALPQDERREIFEAQSHHIGIGLNYLPAVARRLHHCRDLGAEEPFDFITWFEYAPSDSAAFDELVEALRASPEWEYVDREVDIRLTQEEV